MSSDKELKDTMFLNADLKVGQCISDSGASTEDYPIPPNETQTLNDVKKEVYETKSTNNPDSPYNETPNRSNTNVSPFPSPYNPTNIRTSSSKVYKLLSPSPTTNKIFSKADPTEAIKSIYQNSPSPLPGKISNLNNLSSSPLALSTSKFAENTAPSPSPKSLKNPHSIKTVLSISKADSTPQIKDSTNEVSSDQIFPTRAYNSKFVQQISKKHKESIKLLSEFPSFDHTAPNISVDTKSSFKFVPFNPKTKAKDLPSKLKEPSPSVFTKDGFSIKFDPLSKRVKKITSRKSIISELKNFDNQNGPNIQPDQTSMLPDSHRETNPADPTTPSYPLPKKPKLVKKSEDNPNQISDPSSCFEINIDSYFVPNIRNSNSNNSSLKIAQHLAINSENDIVSNKSIGSNTVPSISQSGDCSDNISDKSGTDTETEIDSDLEIDGPKSIKLSDKLGDLYSSITYSFAVFTSLSEPIKIIDLNSNKDSHQIKSITILKSSITPNDGLSWDQVYFFDNFDLLNNSNSPSLGSKSIGPQHYTTHTTSSLIKSLFPTNHKIIANSPKSRSEIPAELFGHFDPENDSDTQISKNIVSSVKAARKSSIISRSHNPKSSSKSRRNSSIVDSTYSPNLSSPLSAQAVFNDYYELKQNKSNSFVFNNQVFIEFGSIGRFKVIVKLYQKLDTLPINHIYTPENSDDQSDEADLLDSFHKHGYDVYNSQGVNFIGLPECSYAKATIRVPYIKIPSSNLAETQDNDPDTQSSNQDSHILSPGIKSDYLTKVLDHESNGLTLSGKNWYVENSTFFINTSSESRISSQSHKILLNKCKKGSSNNIRKTLSTPESIANPELISKKSDSFGEYIENPTANLISENRLNKANSFSTLSTASKPKQRLTLTKSFNSNSTYDVEPESHCICCFNKKLASNTAQKSTPSSKKISPKISDYKPYPCFTSHLILSTSFTFASTKLPLKFSIYSKKPKSTDTTQSELCKFDITKNLNKSHEIEPAEHEPVNEEELEAESNSITSPDFELNGDNELEIEPSENKELEVESSEINHVDVIPAEIVPEKEIFPGIESAKLITSGHQTRNINGTPKNKSKIYSVALLFIIAVFFAISAILLDKNNQLSFKNSFGSTDYNLKSSFEALNDIHSRLVNTYNRQIYDRICYKSLDHVDNSQETDEFHIYTELEKYRQFMCKYIRIENHSSIISASDKIEACMQESEFYSLNLQTALNTFECNFEPICVRRTWRPQLLDDLNSKVIDEEESSQKPNIKTIKLSHMNSNYRNDDDFEGFFFVYKYFKRVTRFIYVFLLW
ncbi:hypothetical protein AYI69_g7799 [Smittium culicis]|uniref:Uncharacterized protein n=1 Tax=Smittium culicis TaxID=133412 RepID=A0A1R1XPK0_9FUNG|nr:hypothetical protein AYI69_g7799 [Smittium culicis]